MSTTIDQSFVRDYVADFKEEFQRAGSQLRDTIRRKDGIIGSSTTFQKIGTGTATTKARHGVITPMNQSHTPIEVTLVDFYAGDYVDKLDEAKTNIDERKAIASGGAQALGRKVDDQITTQLDATTQSTVTWTLTNARTIRNALLGMVEAFFANNVAADGQNYGLLTPRAWSQAMTVKEFSESDFVGVRGLTFDKAPAINQMWKAWMGILWKLHTGLPGLGTSTAKVFVYARGAVGYAAGATPGNLASASAMVDGPVAADITWVGPRAAHFVNHFMSGQAGLIDDKGVIEGNLDDTTAVQAID